MSRTLTDSGVDALEGDKDRSPELALMMKNARRASDFPEGSGAREPAGDPVPAGRARAFGDRLEELLSLRQTTVSQQLARLRLDHLVVARRDGKTVYYSLADDGVKQFVGVIHGMFCKRP